MPVTSGDQARKILREQKERKAEALKAKGAEPEKQLESDTAPETSLETATGEVKKGPGKPPKQQEG